MVAEIGQLGQQGPLEEVADRLVVGGFGGAQRGDSLVEHLAEHAGEERLLIREIQIDGPLGNSGPRCDVADPGAAVAVGEEQRERGVSDRLTGLGGLLRAGTASAPGAGVFRDHASPALS